MPLEKNSPCKVNLLLNVLGRRADGFHELETVMHPVGVCDRLTFQRGGDVVELSCNDAALPVDSRNFIHRAVTSFLKTAMIREGVKIHLEKRIPLAAGLGGGSGNAATTLLALNELFGWPLAPERIYEMAVLLGSDIPFFLQNLPALATGRGEKIQPLENFPALRDKAFLLIYPGFGIATAWAYQNLSRFPGASGGKSGRAQKLISLLQTADVPAAAAEFYNSLEAPAFEKFPILGLFQEFLRANGALAALMSGSGSATFAVVATLSAGETLAEKFKSKFGKNCWTAVVPVYPRQPM
jgi:4-diphosphocytidyl-2-C-methyl-D-erythritol kinase